MFVMADNWTMKNRYLISPSVVIVIRIQFLLLHCCNCRLFISSIFNYHVNFERLVFFQITSLFLKSQTKYRFKRFSWKLMKKAGECSIVCNKILVEGSTSTWKNIHEYHSKCCQSSFSRSLQKCKIFEFYKIITEFAYFININSPFTLDDT